MQTLRRIQGDLKGATHENEQAECYEKRKELVFHKENQNKKNWTA
jgi:hypothetical protein